MIYQKKTFNWDTIDSQWKKAMVRTLFQSGVLAGLLFLISSNFLLAQSSYSPFAPREGLPLIRNFSPKEYQAHEQIWDIAQHPDGRMFFGAGDGLLAFDNENWQYFTLSNRSPVRSMGFAEDSTLYIGGHDELGYLKIDEANQMKFISLLSQLPAYQQNFGPVRSTIPLGNQVFFQAGIYHLFIWDGTQFSVHTFEEGIGRLFLIKGQIYTQLRDTGLVRWEGDRFHTVTGHELFKENFITCLLDWGNDKILAITYDNELFLIKGDSIEPFAIQAGLQGISPREGVLLDQEYLGLTTNLGYVILDRQGNRTQTFTIESGLPSMDILSQFVDRDNNIWLGTQRGIAQILTGYPLGIFDAKTDLHGVLEQIEIFQNKLFAATREGLFILGTEAPAPMFTRSSVFKDRIWELYAYDHSLLIGSGTAIYEWMDNDFHFVGNYDLPDYFYASDNHPNLLWVSLDRGLAALRRTEEGWEEIGKLETIDGSVRSLIEYQPGVVWLGSRTKGMYRLNFTIDEHGYPDFNQVEITSFGAEEGVPLGDLKPILVQGQLCVFIYHTNTWHRYDDVTEQFESIDTGALFGLEKVTLRPQHSIDGGKELWLIGQDSVAVNRNFALHATQQPDGGLKIKKYQVPYPLASFRECLFASEDHLYFGGLEGILALDRQYQYDSTIMPKPPVISSVTYEQNPVSFISSEPNYLPYQKNAAIRLAFGTPLYAPFSKNSYRTKLLGFEEEWSEWSREPYKEYTNLWEGNYQFLVQTIDSYGTITPSAIWSFTIAAPWYRQHWIYGAYLLCLISLVYGLVSWRSSQLKKDKERLENMVQERTSQLAKQRNQLAVQSEKLQEMDKVKSRFFANISHEFRTPLTLILGLLSKHQNKTSAAELQSDLGIMQRNARSLLQLINQLLELSRLEVGTTKLSVQKQDAVEFIRQKISGFQSLADQKKLQLTFNQKPLEVYIPMLPVPLYFDAEKLEQVINNLIANAIKYTPEGREIDVSVGIEETYFMATFKNTGVGIRKEAQAHVFERFYQASDHSQYEGTGIGLAIVKELTALHHGNISLESIPDEYTTFILRLRLGHAHFKSEEIVQSSPGSDSIESAPAQSTSSVLDKPSSETENKPVVMIVEDNEDLRKFIKGQLREQYSICEAADGEAGWKAIEEELPDLVVSDIMMPKLNGMDLCQRIKTSEKTNHIPVILLTAKATMEDKVQGLSLGADDYLVKPFDALELVTRIQNLIGIRQALRDKFATQNLLVPSQDATPSQQQLFLTKLRQLLDDYLNDEQFGVEKMSEQLSMSRTQTHRKIKAITGMAPSVLIRSYRLQTAKEFIRQDVGNFSDIAFRTGFSSLSYFSRCFQDEFGCSPSEFKQQEKGPSSEQPDWITDFPDKLHNT